MIKDNKKPMKPPYTCIRCNYETRDRSFMRKHFNNKKPCPAVNCNIELTDEIKTCILDNRIYQTPKPSECNKIINNTINYHNTMNNFIANMDVIEKITKYVAYTKVPHIGFEDNIRNKYEDEAEYLRNPKNLPVQAVAMKQDDLLMIIDSVTKTSKELHNNVDINFLYDNIAKKLRIYQDGEWNDKFIANGVKELIQCIQQTYLNDYEMYLIKKYYNPSTHFATKSTIIDCIQDYYKFLAAFEREPYVKGKNDRVLIDRGNPYDYDVEEYFMKLYRKPIPNTEVRKIQKDVLEIIKGNTKRNIEEFNKKVLSLIHMDDTFKENMLSFHSGNLALIDEIADEE